MNLMSPHLPLSNGKCKVVPVLKHHTMKEYTGQW